MPKECSCFLSPEGKLLLWDVKCKAHAPKTEDDFLSEILSKNNMMIGQLKNKKFRCYLYPKNNSFMDGIKGTCDDADPEKAIRGARFDCINNVVKHGGEVNAVND